MTRGAAFRSLLHSHDRSGRYKTNGEPARFVRVHQRAATLPERSVVLGVVLQRYTHTCDVYSAN